MLTPPPPHPFLSHPRVPPLAQNMIATARRRIMISSLYIGAEQKGELVGERPPRGRGLFGCWRAARRHLVALDGLGLPGIP